MGIWYEAMIRWVGRATKVTAMTSINVNSRKEENGEMVDVSIPDHVSVIAELTNGAMANMQFSAVTGLSSGNGVWIYGSEGTLHVDGAQNVYGGQRGDDKLQEINNPEEDRAYWRVEEEFCNAIRGQEKITRTPFEVGLHYMEFTEAVTRSSQTGQTVALPL
jgi:predicted dehydrogenase